MRSVVGRPWTIPALPAAIPAALAAAAVLTALAAPVHGPTADVIAALAISGPTLRLPPERVAELKPVLTKEAAALSARLGHSDKGRRAA